MELVGSLAGFWQYHFMEPLAVVFVLSWALNSWAIHCITYLMGIDLGAYKDRYLIKSVKLNDSPRAQEFTTHCLHRR